MDTLIRVAIANRKLLEFSYHGLQRVVEPHYYGSRKGVAQLLTYQIDGLSNSGPLPNWRCFDLMHIEDLRILERSFPGPRDPQWGRHGNFDVTFASVR